MRYDDDDVEVNFPFFNVRVGGSGRTRMGFGDDEEVIDMERDDSGEYREVRRTVRRRLRFLRHASTFLLINSFLFLLDWSTGGGYWVQWVALIWGAFLAWEFVSTFLAPGLWGRDMEERLIRREMRRRRGT
jgi:hypothetical protein